jgi:hypothetical protein
MSQDQCQITSEKERTCLVVRLVVGSSTMRTIHAVQGPRCIDAHSHRTVQCVSYSRMYINIIMYICIFKYGHYVYICHTAIQPMYPPPSSACHRFVWYSTTWKDPAFVTVCILYNKCKITRTSSSPIEEESDLCHFSLYIAKYTPPKVGCKIALEPAILCPGGGLGKTN